MSVHDIKELAKLSTRAINSLAVSILTDCNTKLTVVKLWRNFAFAKPFDKAKMHAYFFSL